MDQGPAGVTTKTSTWAWKSAGPAQFTLLLAVVVVLNALFVSWTEAKKHPGVDFLVYWSVAQSVSDGEVDDVYSPAGGARLTEQIATRAANPYLPPRQRQASELVVQFEQNSVDVVATPFLFTALSLWEHGDYERDLSLFALSSLLLFALAVLGLSRAFGFGPVAAAFFLTLFTLGFGAYSSDVRVANINQIQLASVALVLWLLRKPGLYREVGAGVVLGMSVMFRPSLVLAALLLAAVWLVNRHFGKTVRVFAGTAAGAVLAVGISAVYFGTLACWSGWLRAAPGLLGSKAERGKGSLDYGNYGLVAVLRSVSSIDASVAVLLVLLGAFAFAAWRGRGHPTPVLREGEDPMFFQTAAAVSLGLAFVLLGSTLVWYHYMVMAIPAVLLALAVATRPAATTAARVLAFLGLVCLIRFPLEALPLPLTLRVLLLNLGIVAAATVILLALAGAQRSRLSTAEAVTI